MRRNSRAKSYRNLKVSTASDEDVHFMGAAGEIAVAKLFGFEYHINLDAFRLPDLPHNIEVRTRGNPNYDCKVRPDDDDSRRVVMAICLPYQKPVRIVGWIRAKDGKQARWLIDPYNAGQPMYGVPQRYLLPLSYLREVIAQDPTP